MTNVANLETNAVVLLLLLSSLVCDCFWFGRVYCCNCLVCVVILCVFVVLCGHCSFFYMPACWLEVSTRKVLRPATSTQVFLVSLCLKANAEMVPKIPSCHYMLLM